MTIIRLFDDVKDFFEWVEDYTGFDIDAFNWQEDDCLIPTTDGQTTVPVFRLCRVLGLYVLEQRISDKYVPIAWAGDDFEVRYYKSAHDYVMMRRIDFNRFDAMVQEAMAEVLKDFDVDEE